VAVVSCVPGGGYAAWDGSAIAAAHVTGFAALLLAHHPLFQGGFAHRGEQRVAALFELMRSSCMPYVQVDPLRVGVGLPDLQQVPGLLPAAAQQPTAGAPQAAAAGALLGRLLGAVPGIGGMFGGMAPPPAMNLLQSLQSLAAFPNLPVLMQLRAAGLI
jgi:hypothetical protein